MINVTKPFLPPKAEFNQYIDSIWANNWLTNHGPLVGDLESKLAEYLGLLHLNYVSNGTIALQISIKALELEGEIITTPFSYIATASSIVWEGLKPVFVDICPDTLNIDPQKIEAKITPQTSAILATHVYGNPCQVEAIQQIADQYDLKIIYDAAHCFGTKINGESILNFGDISTISFHATKLFHTTEGGGIVTPHQKYFQKIKQLRNFGHTSASSFDGVGINGKNSEFHAAMGLANLKHIDAIMEKRKAQYLLYQQQLNDPRFTFVKINQEVDFNFAYCPIFFQSEEALLITLKELNNHYIFPRRYFYPALNTIDYLKGDQCEIAESLAARVLCLPLYHSLTQSEQKLVCSKILESTP